MHAELHDAIVAGDADRAGAAMTAHVEATLADVRPWSAASRARFRAFPRAFHARGLTPKLRRSGVRPPQFTRAEGARIARRDADRACFGADRALRGHELAVASGDAPTRPTRLPTPRAAARASRKHSIGARMKPAPIWPPSRPGMPTSIAGRMPVAITFSTSMPVGVPR